MEEELDLAFNDTPYFLEFENCPVKLLASLEASANVGFDEVMIFSDLLWSKVCSYKGSENPYAQIYFEVFGKKVVKTALKSNSPS